MVESVPRDVYGFALKGVTESEQKARAESLSTSRSQARAWQRKTQAGGAAGLFEQRNKLKELLRRGLPPELRPELWLTLSGAGLRLAESPGYYACLCRGLDKKEVPQVPVEVGARFGHHPQFGGSKEGFAALRRLGGALMLHNQEIGFTTGLAAMAAFLLVVYGLQREEEAFWVLASILEDRLFGGLQEQLFFWSKVQEEVLGALVVKKAPRVQQHLAKLNCSISAVTEGWFASLFVMTLPAETVTRIWDSLLCEGPKVLLRVGLALVKKCESAIVMSSDVERMGQIVAYKLRRLFDANSLMELSFKRVGSMKSSHISAISWRMEQIVEKRLEERARFFTHAYGY